MGTARYVGMCGAMTAIGADPSAVIDNPAGLGLYRRSEILLTFDYTLDYTRQPNTTLRGRTRQFMVPQGSIVFCMPTGTLSQGVLSYSFMFSYNRLQSFCRVFNAAGADQPSLGRLFESTGEDMKIAFNTDLYNRTNKLLIRESGYVNEYTLDWAMNYSNRLYWGIGLRIHSFAFSSDGNFEERFDYTNAQGQQAYNVSATGLTFNGADCALATGVIYRPASWVRLGFGIETPSIGALYKGSMGVFEARKDTIGVSYAPDKRPRYTDYHQPLHTSTSVAFQVGYYALLSLQYDYWHGAQRQDKHSLRGGVEVIPIPGMYINAGYAFESSFKPQSQDLTFEIDPELKRQDAYFQYTRWSQYIGTAIGYRGKDFIAQVGYQYRWQTLSLYAHQNAMDCPYDIRTNTHRIVLTLGWHR